MTNELKDLYIIGASGFGRETADTVHDINQEKPRYRIAGFIDNDINIIGTQINGIEVLGPDNYLIELKQQSDERPCAVIAIADPHIKERIVNKLDKYVVWENIIHPSVAVKSGVVIGQGNIIQQFSVVSSNVTVGDHCIINYGCILGHDVKCGDYSSVMPICGIMGACEISEKVYIGTGAMIIQGLKVGKRAVVGAGTVVVKEVEEGATVVGNPARRIK